MKKEPRTIASGAGADDALGVLPCGFDEGGPAARDSRPTGLDCPPVQIRVPIRTVNGTNAREHWGTRKRRAASERQAVAWMLACKPIPSLPCRVVLTREGPNRRALDSDGLQAACKHVRDQVAAWLGVDDADKRVTWDYWQSRSRDYGVLIEIRGA